MGLAIVIMFVNFILSALIVCGGILYLIDGFKHADRKDVGSGLSLLALGIFLALNVYVIEYITDQIVYYRGITTQEEYFEIYEIDTKRHKILRGED